MQAWAASLDWMRGYAAAAVGAHERAAALHTGLLRRAAAAAAPLGAEEAAALAAAACDAYAAVGDGAALGAWLAELRVRPREAGARGRPAGLRQSQGALAAQAHAPGERRHDACGAWCRCGLACSRGARDYLPCSRAQRRRVCSVPSTGASWRRLKGGQPGQALRERAGAANAPGLPAATLALLPAEERRHEAAASLALGDAAGAQVGARTAPPPPLDRCCLHASGPAPCMAGSAAPLRSTLDWLPPRASLHVRAPGSGREGPRAAQAALRLAAWAPALEFGALDAWAGEAAQGAHRLPAAWAPHAPPPATLAQAAARGEEAALLAELGAAGHWLAVPIGAGRVLDAAALAAHLGAGAGAPPRAPALAARVAAGAARAGVAAAAALARCGTAPTVALLPQLAPLALGEEGRGARLLGAAAGACAELASAPALGTADRGLAAPGPGARGPECAPWLRALRLIDGAPGAPAAGPDAGGLRLRLARAARARGNVGLAQRLLLGLLAGADAGLRLAAAAERAALRRDGGDARGAALALWQALEPLVASVSRPPVDDRAPAAVHACLLLAAWAQAGALPNSGAPAGDAVARACLTFAAAAAPPAGAAAAAAHGALADWLLARAGAGGGREPPDWEADAPAAGGRRGELWAALCAGAAALAADARRADAGSPLESLRVLQALAALGGGGADGEAGTEGAGESGAGAELARVPARAWRAVAPQLLAHLQHPAAGVRTAAAGLLRALARAEPAAALYPVLREAGLAGAGGAAGAGELAALAAALRRANPAAAAAAEALMAEAARVAVLWEEQWHAALQEVLADVARRAPAADAEAARLAGAPPGERAVLLAERYTAVMAPPAAAVEARLRATVDGGAATPAEAAFAARYGPRLRGLLAALRAPAAGGEPAAAALAAARALAASLAARLGRGDQALALAELSPALARLAGSAAPMPCAEGGAGVTLAAVDGAVVALATKTRPKRLRLLGSDGVARDFLLKARPRNCARPCRPPPCMGGGRRARGLRQRRAWRGRGLRTHALLAAARTR